MPFRIILCRFLSLHLASAQVGGHTFYTIIGAGSATTYLGNGFWGQFVDFFNPLSIPKDMADIYNDLENPGDDGGGCGCQQ